MFSDSVSAEAMRRLAVLSENLRADVELGSLSENSLQADFWQMFTVLLKLSMSISYSYRSTIVRYDSSFGCVSNLYKL